MHHKPAPPVTDARGNEHHPAFGMLSVNRVTSSHGISLFQSDLAHRSTIRITLETASRTRDLNHDWVHGEKHLVEVEMSLAQWASVVSSIDTSGVPVTIRALPGDHNIDGIPFAPRMAESLAEVRAATARSFSRIQEALKKYEETPNSPVAAKRAALRQLHYAVEGTEGTLTFAAESMEAHAENVVQKARADVEAMVLAEANRLGLTGSQARLLELPVWEEPLPVATDVLPPWRGTDDDNPTVIDSTP